MHLRDSIGTEELPGVKGEAAAGLDEAVMAACAVALLREEAGEYEAARSELSEYWQGIGEEPQVAGLSPEAQAELLLRCGAISGKLGSAKQIKGAQEQAKDLLSQASRRYEELKNTEKVAEAELELAICYWREGAVEEARDTLKHALQQNPNLESEQRIKSLVTQGIIESSASRYEEAIRIYSEVAPRLKSSKNHLLRGVFHNQFAVAYKNLLNRESRQDYVDRAFMEYTAAGYHFEQAGHTRYLALVENNLGFLYLTIKKPLEAHQHLNRARALFVKLRDKGRIAQVDETRAVAFLAQGLNSQAETTVRGSVRTLEEGDEVLLLAEALITHGTALARLERYERAYAQLRRAIDLANVAGNQEKAGLAALTIVESLSQYVLSPAVRLYYRDAESQLADSQSPDKDDRLAKCARKILSMEMHRIEEPVKDSHAQPGIVQATEPIEDAQPRRTVVSLEEEVMRYEGELIHRALESVGGSVTRAARLLGITHQGLAFILNGRHQQLLAVRTPVRRRRKSIFKPQ
ncbi:MAG TPA: helix-turn-helix domain-containing protein [Pyrinomonadaceae bacterium]|jgi:tetratricopeptide (TPR) repeat protein|nr:helix-turn-helix domain-containing protein [Pyrinomonadaceae bacterium]